MILPLKLMTKPGLTGVTADNHTGWRTGDNRWRYDERRQVGKRAAEQGYSGFCAKTTGDGYYEAGN